MEIWTYLKINIRAERKILEWKNFKGKEFVGNSNKRLISKLR